MEVTPINIAICEDNAADAAIIHDCIMEHLEKNSYMGDIHTFTSGEAMLAAFSPGLFDVVFLDIYMNGISGLETAGRMRALDPGFALVYITISANHAMEAFGLRACAYVAKPLKPDQMEIAFTQCHRVFLKNARYIEVMSERQAIKIPLVKIVYVEVYGKNALFHNTTGIVRTNMPLEDIERKLSASFLRCHRSYLINMNQVDRIQKQDILMKNGDAVPMRQRGRLEIKSAYGDFLSNRLFEVD